MASFFRTFAAIQGPKKMLIYNTTYQVNFDDARNFVIWVHQVYIPKATAEGLLAKPRLCKILSHRDEDSECFSLQFEVKDSAALHQWYTACGTALDEEMRKLFKDKAAGFSTLMEIIEEA